MPEGLGGLAVTAPPEGLEDYIDSGRLINRPPPLPNLRSPRQLALSAAPTVPREVPKKLPTKAAFANSTTPAAVAPALLAQQLAQVADINLDILPVISGGAKRRRPKDRISVDNNTLKKQKTFFDDFENIFAGTPAGSGRASPEKKAPPAPASGSKRNVSGGAFGFRGSIVLKNKLGLERDPNATVLSSPRNSLLLRHDIGSEGRSLGFGSEDSQAPRIDEAGH